MTLTLEDARTLMAAAQDIAARMGKPMTVCIVDAGGYTVALDRMTGGRPLQPSIALAKAYSAAVMQRPTKALKMWAQYDPGLFSQVARMGHQPVVACDGGLPIAKDGVILGGIGASGGSGEEDEEIVIGALKAGGYDIEF